MQNVIDNASLVIPEFDDILEAIIHGEYDRIILKGGRNSTKSSVIALGIIEGVMFYKADAVCMVKYNNKVDERLVSTFNEVLNRTNLHGYFKYNQTKKELVLLDSWNGRPTKYAIKFTGVDDPHKLKSFKPRSGAGGFRWVWFEEVTDFYNLPEVTNVINTMARGEGEHTVIMSYNPPKQTGNWVNQEYNNIQGELIGADSKRVLTEFNVVYGEGIHRQVKKVRQLVHHSTYLDVVAGGRSEWLGFTLIQAEQTKRENPKQYDWEYMGVVTGTDANVFTNVCEWDSELEPINPRTTLRGLDWGSGGPDPTIYGEYFYDVKNKRLYILQEFGKPKMSLQTVGAELLRANIHNFPIYCDSAVPEFNNQIKKMGVNAVPVKKRPNSVLAGVRWLQSLNGIYIDKRKTPMHYKEFKEYSYMIDRNEQLTAELPDADNHCIDTCRYALNNHIKY